MTIVLPAQSKLAGQKEELTKVKDANRVLEKANEKLVAEVADLQKQLKLVRADRDLSKNETKTKNGFDTRERELKLEISRLKLKIEQKEKELQDKDFLIDANHRASKKKDEELKQYKLDMKDFEAMKKENIELKRSIMDNTEVRDAKRKMEMDRLRIQRAADGKVRRVEQELEARDEKIARLQRAAAQQEEEEGDEASEGMDD